MIKNIIAVLLLILGALAAMNFLVGVPQVYEQPSLQIVTAHKLEDPEYSLEEISVLAFYFVPKNKSGRMIDNWYEVLDESLSSLQEFHLGQFKNSSILNYRIYPEPIIGLNENLKYDTLVTQNGNPEALRNVSREIEDRVLDPNGDLFRSDFLLSGIPYSSDRENPYYVLAIIYEGVGASGSDNVTLISSSFLSEERFSSFGPTILTHEFYHSFGVPDAYNIESAIPLGSDIMGYGRFKPLKETYMDKKTLRALGI